MQRILRVLSANLHKTGPEKSKISAICTNEARGRRGLEVTESRLHFGQLTRCGKALSLVIPSEARNLGLACFQSSSPCPSADGHPETMKFARRWTDVARASRPPSRERPAPARGQDARATKIGGTKPECV